MTKSRSVLCCMFSYASSFSGFLNKQIYTLNTRNTMEHKEKTKKHENKLLQNDGIRNMKT